MRHKRVADSKQRATKQSDGHLKTEGVGKQERIVEELNEWSRNKRGGGTLKTDRKIYIAKGSSRKPWVFGQGKYDPSQRALVPRGQ